MANNFADQLEQNILKHFLKAGASGAIAQPTSLYLCLFTADPTEAGSTANEVASGVGYARQAIAFAAVSANGTATRTSNNAQITFGPATGAWGTVSYFAVVDAAAATPGSAVTTWLITGPLAASKTIATNDSLVVASGNLTVDVD